jgi:membrane protease YdiL (CAAX protease family)
MPANPAIAPSFVSRHSITAYFVLTFAVSWLGAFLVASPHLFRHEPLPQLTGIMMFPAMLLGPSLVAVPLTGIVDGRAGLRDLRSRMWHAKFPLIFYAALLIPPLLILAVLMCLKTFVSAEYAPNLFPVGIAFGVPAGILEEIGWMGYAFPKMWSGGNALRASVLLGVLWSAWHLPVINFLGVATPRGAYWLPFFLAFALAMTAMRVLIAWLYVNTKSVLLAQLMHVSSTGFLVAFGASHVTSREEVSWYALYGLALWTVVGMVVWRNGVELLKRASSRSSNS